MNSYYWAWLALKNKKDVEPREDRDEGLIVALIDGIFSNTVPSGTGAFSRLENFAKSTHQIIGEVKVNLCGSDENFLAFVLGLEAAYETVVRMAQKIKKRSN